MHIITTEQIEPRYLMICDSRGRRKYNASWGIFALAVVIAAYGLGLLLTVAYAYIDHSHAAITWANHVLFTLYNPESTFIVGPCLFIFMLIWRIPFLGPLYWLATLELGSAYVLMFAAPHHRWVVLMAVMVGMRVAYGKYLHRGLLNE